MRSEAAARTSTATKSNANEMRARISRAAFEILADHGFEGASVAAIARHAGLSTGSVYQYFTDKREIIDTAFDEAVTSLILALDPDATLAQQPDDRDQTVDLVTTLARRGEAFLAENPRIVNFVVAQASAADVEIRHRVLGLEALFTSRIAHGVRRAIEKGWIEADVDVSALVSRMVLMLALPFVNEMRTAPVQRPLREAMIRSSDQLARHGLLTGFSEPEAAALRDAVDDIERSTVQVAAVIAHDGGRRALLLDAALDLYEQRGYHGVKPAAIAERAGFGYGTFYNYFANRRECHQQVLERELALIGALGEVHRPLPVDRTEFVANLAQRATLLAVYATRRGRQLLSLLLDSVGIDDAGAATVANFFTRFSQLIGADLNESATQDIVRPSLDQRLTGQFVVAAVMGMVVHVAQESTPNPSQDPAECKLVVATFVRTLCSGADHQF